MTKANESRLVIQNFTAADQGEYLCNCSNKAGVDEANVTLSLYGEYAMKNSRLNTGNKFKLHLMYVVLLNPCSFFAQLVLISSNISKTRKDVSPDFLPFKSGLRQRGALQPIVFNQLRESFSFLNHS